MMDTSIQYARVMSNFDSVYNATPNPPPPPRYSFSPHPSLSISPPLSSSNPKFNLDLYQPTQYFTSFSDYPSPSSSVIVHHHHVHSPRPSQAISKLRQINDELCYTLAQADLPPAPVPCIPPNYYVHHHPVSHRTAHSPPVRDASPEFEPAEPRRRNARITHKVHIPRHRRRRRHEQSPQSAADFEQLLASTSDAYAQDDPLTVDVYPTHDQGYVRRIRNRPDNRSPWLPDSALVRRNSYSGDSTYRSVKASDYGNEPIQPPSRLSDCKVRPRSSSAKSRLRRSATSFSAAAPVWRPNGSIKNPKFMGSNAPPSPPKRTREPAWKPAFSVKSKNLRAFDPMATAPSKIHEPVWNPTSVELKHKPTRYFEPTVKAERTIPTRSLSLPRKPSKNVSKVARTDPALKMRIAGAESKVKSAWTEGPPPSKPRPPLPRPTTAAPPAKTKPKPVRKPAPARVTPEDTGRSSLTGVPANPMFQSTPRNQSFDDDDAVKGMFGDESKVSVVPKKPVPKPPPPRPIEKTPPKKPSTPVPEPEAQNNSTIKDDVLVHGDHEDSFINDDPTPPPPPPPRSEANEDLDNRSAQPSPIPSPRADPSPKPSHADETHDDVETSFDTNKSPKADVRPSTPPQATGEATPRPIDSEGEGDISFESESQPPAPPRPPSPPAATTDNAADDFFD